MKHDIKALVDELNGFAIACGASEPGDGAFNVISLTGSGSEELERNLRAVLREAASALSLTAGETVVKPLEWHAVEATRSDEDPSTEETGDYTAATPFGGYYIEMYFGSDSYGWETTLNGVAIADNDAPEAAQAAAQADYEARIRSALMTTPAAPKLKCALCGEDHDNDLGSDICQLCEASAPWRDEEQAPAAPAASDASPSGEPTSFLWTEELHAAFEAVSVPVHKVRMGELLLFWRGLNSAAQFATPPAPAATEMVEHSGNSGELRMATAKDAPPHYSSEHADTWAKGYNAALAASPAPAAIDRTGVEDVVEAMARSDAAFDKREWLGMPKTERERYLNRSRLSFGAALANVLGEKV